MSELRMVKIGDYCSVLKGKIGIKNAIPGKYPLVTTAEDRSSHIECHFDKPSVIIPLVSSTGHGHASLKRIHYQEGKFAVGSILCAVIPKNENILDARFLYHYLDVYKENLLVSLMQGMANVTLSIDKIKEIQFPLLPIEKQAEWIRLFERVVSFTNGLLTESTHQQTLLRKLRQSILQDAISGKLTEQWRKDNPDVEPASELLKRSKEEKERLVKEKKIPKQNPLPPITEDELPFELPEGWVWCRLGESTILITSGSRDWAQYYSESGAKFLRMGNLSRESFKLRLDNIQYVKPQDNGEGTRTQLKEDDLLISITGDVGLLGLIPSGFGEAYINQHTGLIRFHKEALAQYFAYLFLTKLLIVQFNAPQRGIKNSFRLSDIQNLLIPLPPKKECMAIIQRIEKTFQFCDQLETKTTQSQQNSEMLMQTVLKEAFEE